MSLNSSKKVEDSLSDKPETELSIRYEAVHAAIFEPHCIKCHSAQGSAEPDLSNYESLKEQLVLGDPLNSPVYLSLRGVDGTMPRRAPALAPELIQLMSDWIEQGAQN